MVIDVRPNVSLGFTKNAAVVVPALKPAPGTAFSPRTLARRGTPIFELSLWCGTCPALFKKLTETEAADLGLANELLNAGLQRVDDRVLQMYGRVLPKSRYTVLLLDLVPRLVQPGDPFDYFTHEQVTTWGVDPYIGSPEDPGTPYYRTFETPVSEGQHLYEFVVWRSGLVLVL